MMGAKTLFLPRQNKHEVESLPVELKSKLNFIFVKNVKEILPLLFPTLQSTVYKKKVKEATDLLSKLVGAASSSKVVGDLASFMLERELSEEQICRKYQH